MTSGAVGDTPSRGYIPDDAHTRHPKHVKDQSRQTWLWVILTWEKQICGRVFAKDPPQSHGEQRLIIQPARTDQKITLGLPQDSRGLLVSGRHRITCYFRYVMPTFTFMFNTMVAITLECVLPKIYFQFLIHFI